MDPAKRPDARPDVPDAPHAVHVPEPVTLPGVFRHENDA